jgi:tripartite-type tricarboxylate transporter receptor subunit TctC
MNVTARFLFPVALAACAFTAAHAQGNYPDKPIHMIIPLAAGSAVDSAARVLAQTMSQGLGQPIVIENLPGAAGLIGAGKLARTAPDGYTIGGFNDSILTMVPHVYANVSYDALTDFDPLSLVGTIEWGLVVKPDSPFKTAQDFLAAAKSSPGKIKYSSGGIGSPQHVGMALLAERAGKLDMLHVPYKGATPGAVAVAAGEVDAGFQGLGTVTPLLKAGKLRLLAVGTKTRLGLYPDVPTIDESALEGFFFNSWFALVFPAGTPKEIVERVNGEVRKALAQPETRDKIGAQGMTLVGSTAAEMGTALKAQYELYRRLITDNGIKAQ